MSLNVDGGCPDPECTKFGELLLVNTVAVQLVIGVSGEAPPETVVVTVSVDPFHARLAVTAPGMSQVVAFAVPHTSEVPALFRARMEKL